MSDSKGAEFMVKTLIGKLNLAIVLGFLLFTTPEIKGQNPPVYYQQFTTKNGLCDNAIVDIEKDANGYIWLATQNGLSKFNGRNFENYFGNEKVSGGLRSSWITGVLCDKTGTIWVSTEFGLCYYSPLQNNFIYVNSKSQLLSLYRMPMIAEGDNIWIASNDGIWKVNIYTKKLISVKNSKIFDPRNILFDKNGKLIITTLGYGLVLYDTSAKSLQTFHPKTLPLNADLLQMCKINDEIYIATEFGLLVMDKFYQERLYNKIDTQPASKVEALTALQPYKLNDANLLCGSYDGKIYLFNTATKKFVDKTYTFYAYQDMPVSNILSITTHEDNLFIGTTTGLLSINFNRQLIVSQKIPLQQNMNFDIKSITDGINSDTKWIVSNEPSKIFLYDVSENVVKRELSLNNKEPYTATYSNDKYFLIAAGNVLYANNIEGRALYKIALKSKINCMSMQDGNVVWIGTANGIAKLDLATKNLKEYNITYFLKDKEIETENEFFATRHLTIDKQNEKVWISSIKYGLFSFDMNTSRVIAYRQSLSYGYNARNRCIASVKHTNKNMLWLATMAGLTAFDINNNQFVNYSYQSGKTPNYIYKLCYDISGNLWMRTNEGIFYYTDYNTQFSRYSLPVYATDNMVNQPLHTYKNKMILGLSKSLIILQPDTKPVSFNKHALIKYCKTSDTTYYFSKSTASVNLENHQNSIVIGFDYPDYSGAEPINYEYRLYGKDNYFRSTSHLPEVLFSNLPAGEYEFELRANVNGIHSDVSKFHIHIANVFYKTTFFKFSLALLALGLLYGFFMYRIAQYRKRQAIRNKISKNLHDDLGASLSSLTIYSNIGLQSTKEENSKNLFEKIYSSSLTMQESVSDIVWYINPRRNSLADIWVKLRDFANSLFEISGINTEFISDFNETTKIPIEDREHIYLILKEGINNCLKYSKCKNAIVAIVQKNDMIFFRIEDNGVGFDLNQIKRTGNGLHNMRERAKILKANLQIITSIGNGCKLILEYKIPHLKKTIFVPKNVR